MSDDRKQRLRTLAEWARPRAFVVESDVDAWRLALWSDPGEEAKRLRSEAFGFGRNVVGVLAVVVFVAATTATISAAGDRHWGAAAARLLVAAIAVALGFGQWRRMLLVEIYARGLAEAEILSEELERAQESLVCVDDRITVYRIQDGDVRAWQIAAETTRGMTERAEGGGSHATFTFEFLVGPPISVPWIRLDDRAREAFGRFTSRIPPLGAAT